jgi:hexokinase
MMMMMMMMILVTMATTTTLMMMMMMMVVVVVVLLPKLLLMMTTMMITTMMTMMTIAGCFRFEKSFSGLYLGELVRLVLVRLVEVGALFDGKLPESLAKYQALTTAHVTDIDR